MHNRRRFIVLKSSIASRTRVLEYIDDSSTSRDLTSSADIPENGKYCANVLPEIGYWQLAKKAEAVLETGHRSAGE